MKQFVLTLALVLSGICTQLSYGGWGSGGCSPAAAVAAPVYVSRAPFTGWYTYNGCQYYYRDGVQIAGWNGKDYRTYDAVAGQWSEPQAPPWCTCPADAPCNGKCPNGCKCEPAVAVENFGIDESKIRKDGKTHYRMNGRDATHAEVVDALQLSDDSGTPFVTFIGNNRDAAYQAFLKTPDAAKCRVKSYPADAWEVSRVGFVTTGNPTIYVQKPTGEVVARFDSDPGADKLTQAIRKADPTYDPSKDPNGNPLPFDPKNIPTSAWVLGGLGLFALLMHRKAA